MIKNARIPLTVTNKIQKMVMLIKTPLFKSNIKKVEFKYTISQYTTKYVVLLHTTVLYDSFNI